MQLTKAYMVWRKRPSISFILGKHGGLNATKWRLSTTQNLMVHTGQYLSIQTAHKNYVYTLKDGKSFGDWIVHIGND